jgi:hypothetical protein
MTSPACWLADGCVDKHARPARWLADGCVDKHARLQRHAPSTAASGAIDGVGRRAGSGADVPHRSLDDDDTEPSDVSDYLDLQLRLRELSSLSKIFKYFGITTWRSFGRRSGNDAIVCQMWACIVAQDHSAGAISRLRAMIDHANDEYTHDPRCDAAPALVSNKLAASMAGRGIGGLLQVLVACDVLSYKALTVLTDADFAHIFTLAVEQGFEAEEALLLVDLHVEARNTRPCNHQPADYHYDSYGAYCVEARNTRPCRHQPADHHYDSWGVLCRCVQAFVIVSELASRDGWKHPPCPCAAAVRSARLTLRDVCAWRAVSIVGISDRSMYLHALNTCSEYAFEKKSMYACTLKSQVLMAFATNFGHLPDAFSSNSAKDARRRGMQRPRRRRLDDESKGAIEAETSAGGSTLNAASSSFWPHEEHLLML